MPSIRNRQAVAQPASPRGTVAGAATLWVPVAMAALLQGDHHRQKANMQGASHPLQYECEVIRAKLILAPISSRLMGQTACGGPDKPYVTRLLYLGLVQSTVRGSPEPMMVINYARFHWNGGVQIQQKATAPGASHRPRAPSAPKSSSSRARRRMRAAVLAAGEPNFAAARLPNSCRMT